jgi:hypothetical protein
VKVANKRQEISFKTRELGREVSIVIRFLVSMEFQEEGDETESAGIGKYIIRVYCSIRAREGDGV